ncbi:sorbosone dehydrogenase family protein [Virgibacillus oceani]
MKKLRYFSLLGIVLVAGVIFFINTPEEDSADESPDSTSAEDEDLFNQEAAEVLQNSVEVVATDDGSINANNLFIPWTINKDGSKFFLSQRDGMIVEIDADFGIVDVQTVEVTKDILHEGEGGFLGFTLDPDFETNNMAYAYHTYESNGNSLNRIVSLSLQDKIWKEEEVLLENIPAGEINSGGRIEIGPDDMLYATTGDTGQSELAQQLDSLAGKILRMEKDGQIPESNPFPDSYVFSYGHRNAQGMAWDEDGNFYSSEHGETGHDEINLIEAGGNYGWPVIEGDEEYEDMITPIHHSGEETWAPSGMAYYNGELYVASLAGSKLFTYDLESQTENDFFGDVGRLRDVFIDDNALFTITNNHDDRGTPNEEDDQLIHIPMTEEAATN